MEKKIKIFIENLDKNVLMSQGSSLLEGLLARDVSINHACGGNGTCGTCRVEVVSDLKSLPARNEIEQEMADDRGFKKEERLACQLDITKTISIRIP